MAVLHGRRRGADLPKLSRAAAGAFLRRRECDRNFAFVSAAQTVADPDNLNAKISFNQLPGTRAELAAIVSEEGSKTGVLTGKQFMDETFTTKNLIDSLGKSADCRSA